MSGSWPGQTPLQQASGWLSGRPAQTPRCLSAISRASSVPLDLKERKSSAGQGSLRSSAQLNGPDLQTLQQPWTYNEAWFEVTQRGRDPGWAAAARFFAVFKLFCSRGFKPTRPALGRSDR